MIYQLTIIWGIVLLIFCRWLVRRKPMARHRCYLFPLMGFEKKIRIW